MFDDILDLFNRRKRQHEADCTPSAPRSRLPFDVPFLEDDDDDATWDRRRHEDERQSPHRPSSSRQTRDEDWF